MTKVKLEELIEKAKPFLNKEVNINFGVDKISEKLTLTPYIFISTGIQVLFREEDGIEFYKINGILKNNDDKIERNLITIVDYFENNKKYI
jgi:hypothetical protein